MRLVEDHEICIYDNLYRNSLPGTGLLEHPNIELVRGNVLDDWSLRRAITKVDPNVVIHLAAMAGIHNVQNNPIRTMDVNIRGTSNLLHLISCHTDELDRFVNFSSSEVFGVYAFKPLENSATTIPSVGEARWTYAVSKLAAEHLVYSYHQQFGIKTVSVRPFNIYGPGQVGEGAVHTLVTRALRGEDLLVQGDGDQIRSWCYIDDLVDGVMLCLEKDGAIGHTFNIGNPKGTTTINMLAYIIKTLSESRSRIINVPKDHVDIDVRIPSIEKATTILGYRPKFDIIEGLTKTIEWYRCQQS